MMSREKNQRLWRAVGLSILLHLLLLWVLLPRLVPDEELASQPDRERELEIVLQTEEPTEEEGRQIVSLDQPPSERPDQARFEDRYERSVEEETVAREQGGVTQAVVVRRPDPNQEQQERQTQRQERRDRRQERRSQERARQEESEAAQPVVAAGEDQEQGEPISEQPTFDRQAERSAQERTPSISDYNPTMATAADLIGVPGERRIDHLNLPQGDRTAINSFENLYWSYWDRIKNQVRPHWQPAYRYRSRDPTGRVFGVEDRYTIVQVTINGDGSVRHLYLERSCDLDFLDREALRAIQQAQPFANVPEGLKDERGLLSFRFGFYFEVSSRSFRIRREDW